MAVAQEVEQLELERDEVQELPMPLRPESVGDGGAEEPEEHEQLSAGTAGRGRDVDGLGATRAWARALGWRSTGGVFTMKFRAKRVHAPRLRPVFTRLVHAGRSRVLTVVHALRPLD